MIFQGLNNDIKMKGKNYVHSKNDLIINSKFGIISKNNSFTVEAYFEHTIIHILKSEYLEKEDMKIILECHPLFEHLYNILNWAKI